MESLTLKVVVVGMTILLAVVIMAALVAAIHFGNKSRLHKKIVEAMEDESESSHRLISLLKSRRAAGEIEL
jgi:hypothetical protein